MEQQVLAWITQYGYAAIFVLLMFGIVGLPVPDETLLTFCGFLVFKGRLALAPAFGTAFAGSACGITLSYVLGRTFGLALIHRYGKYVRIREDHVQKAHAWFARVGHWGLTFGYFVPGLRHFTAYAAGMSEVEPHQFALFAYSGGMLWVSAFLSLGYFLGERWEAVEKNIHQYLIWITVAALIGLAGYLAWRKYFRAKAK
ncbi:MAG TPA: DedA family protein [Candidatus Sulfopaludibacter sp.]|jgi:membrane protein DedA with SNARE-associated domain|nr:DedA family protein [Candidatus Sulfopaludibacter sp.]